MQLKLTIETRQLEAFAGMLPKRLGYATQNALFETAYQLQEVAYRRVGKALHIRDQRLWFGTDKRKGGVAARITEFPSYRAGRLSIALEGGKLSDKAEISGNRRLLVSELEHGGTRRPVTSGAKSVAVPEVGGARATKRAKISPEYRFGKLNLQAYYRSGSKNSRQVKLTKRTRHRTSQGIGVFREFGRLSTLSGVKGIQWKGASRSFMLFGKAHPLGAVYQRIGRGQGPESRRRLWRFDAPFPIKPELRWMPAVLAKAQRYFSRAMDRAIADTLAHDLAKRVAS